MNLKKLREEKKVTLAMISKDLNMPLTTYRNYEILRNQPSIETLIKMANYFDVSLDYLCERPFNNNVGYIPDSRKDLVREIVDLSDSEAREVEVFIKGFKAGRAGRVDFYDDDNKRG